MSATRRRVCQIDGLRLAGSYVRWAQRVATSARRYARSSITPNIQARQPQDPARDLGHNRQNYSRVIAWLRVNV